MSCDLRQSTIPAWRRCNLVVENWGFEAIFPRTMNLSPTFLVRALAAGFLLAAWLPVLTRPNAAVLPSLTISLVMILALVWHARWARASALEVIRRHPLPLFLRQKLIAAHPQLSDADARDVELGLRQFFGASAQAEERFVAMPSNGVDTLWHEFIMHTRGYESVCRKAFGRMLRHTPAEALPTASTGNARSATQREGLRRAWESACRDEKIDPSGPSRLPLLFALDAALGIAGGYVYALDCSLLGADRTGRHCAGDLGSGGGSGGGGSGGYSDSASGGGDAGGGACGGN